LQLDSGATRTLQHTATHRKTCYLRGFPLQLNSGATRTLSNYLIQEGYGIAGISKGPFDKAIALANEAQKLKSIYIYTYIYTYMCVCIYVYNYQLDKAIALANAACSAEGCPEP